MSIKFAARLTAWLALVSFLSLSATAQQTPPPANAGPSAQTQQGAPGQTAPSAQQTKDKDTNTNKDPIKDTNAQTTSGKGTVEGTSNDRLFYTLPNFLTLENAGHVPPLSTKQKYAVVALGSFDYVQYPWYGLLSGISQWEDSEPGLGQGGAAYGKRYAMAFADGTIENFLTGAVLPSILRQDPRYFQSGQGSFWHRAFYAMSRNLITRTDSGGEQFNYSEVVGGALSAAISTYSYHPKSHTFQTPTGPRFIPSDRTLTNTAKVWGTQYAYDTLTLVVKEFWPDIRRKMSKHKGERARDDRPVR